MLTWNLMEIAFDGDGGFGKGRPTAVGTATGALAGLVIVTGGAGFVTPMYGMLMGLIGTPMCFFAPRLVRMTGVDDRLDAFAIHGMGGMVGSALTGLFADSAYTTAYTLTADGVETDVNGSFFGFPRQLGIQCAGISVAILYSVVGTTIIFWLLWALAKFAFGASIAIPIEFHGAADVSQHGEKAYYTAQTVVRGATATAAGDGHDDPLSVRTVAPSKDAAAPPTAPAVAV